MKGKNATKPKVDNKEANSPPYLQIRQFVEEQTNY